MNLSPVAGGVRDLRTLYLPPFAAAVREEWGFDGYTFADHGGVHMLHSFHQTAHSPAEAGKQALEAGLDLEAPADYGYGDTLLQMARAGEVDVALVDQAVARILRVKFLAG